MRKQLIFILGLLFLTGDPTAAQENRFPLPEGYRAERDVVYSVVDSNEIKLDIYYTKESAEPLPLIIWIHGGAWRSGDKRSARFARELLGEGYAVASINYRLSGTAIFPAQIIDCKAAVRWLRVHAGYYNIDPRRFAAWGGSAGSHLAALLGTAEDIPEWEQGNFLEFSSRVQAVVDWFGPTDFSRMDDVPGQMVHLADDSPESALIGASVRDNPEKVARANPITYVNRYNPPFQILHGKDDLLVLPNQAVLLNEAFLGVGLKPDFALLDSTGHGGREWNNFIPRAREFLDRHLIDSPTRARPQPPEPGRRWVYTYLSIDPKLSYARFHSRTIGQEYGYMVYLPPSYIHSTERRYPVIYWLPGRGGNPSGMRHFADLYQEAILDRRAPEAIIIGVNGINSSMYTNDRAGEFPVEDVIVRDLIEHVDESYRTIPLREMRALDGFSMGGFGAARLGFKYPEKFGVISIMGAAMHRPETLKEIRPEIFREVFGNDLDYCSAHSPWTLVRENAGSLAGNILIRQFVGEEDMLVEKNRDFHKLMTELGIPHEFGVVPGARHNYPQVYANFEGDPFAFYRKAFGVGLSDEKWEGDRAKSRPLPDLGNIPYGPDKRQVLDLWKAGSDQPAPLLIFIHGGAFRHGDKSIVYNHELNELLHAGISVASINYRLLDTDPLPAAFLDGKRALQFIRSNASGWNIDPDRIAVFGGSAGAQISMWLAYHDEMADPGSQDPAERQSTRVSFAGSKGGQITMDMEWWDRHIPGYSAVTGREPAFGTPGMKPEETAKLTREYSAMAHVSPGDPPVYVYHKMAPDDPLPVKRWEINSWQVHHVIFGIKLKELADKYGNEVNLNYPGADVQYKSIVEFARAKFYRNE